MLHLGNRKKIKKPTDQLLCGVRCKDQFWITLTQQRETRVGLRAAHGASCKKCLALFKGKG